MNGKRKKIWLIVLAMLASLFILSGCSFGTTKDQIMQENGLNVRVTYHANGGLFENNTNVKDMYYPDGNPALDIGFTEATNVKIVRDGYELEGWYHVAKDQNGKPIYENEEAEVFQLGEKVDFSKRLEKGKDWEICANWLVLTKVKVKLVVFDANEQIDLSTKVKDDAGNEHQTGSEVGAFTYQNGVVNTATLEPFKAENNSHTFVQYYSDEACTQNVNWPIQRDEENDVYIYVKYITGNWKVLKTSRDVSGVFTSTFTGVGYYLLNDITYTGDAISSLSANGFNLKFYGNGHKISGLSISQNVKTVNIVNNFSVFGNLGANADIRDVTFENLNVSFNINGPANVNDSEKMQIQAHYLFNSADENAKVENVGVSGAFNLVIKGLKLQDDFQTNWQHGGTGENVKNLDCSNVTKTLTEK